MGWWPFGKKKKEESVDSVLTASAAAQTPVDSAATATTTSDTSTTAPAATPTDSSAQGLSSIPSPLNPDVDTLESGGAVNAPTASGEEAERSVPEIPEHPAAANTGDEPESTPVTEPAIPASDAAPTTPADDSTPDQPAAPTQP